MIGKTYFFTINEIGKFIFKCNIRQEDVKELNIKSKFWINVLQSWAHVHFNREENINYKSEHPQCYIWYNSNIKLHKKLIYFKPWQEKGINYIKDLLNQNGAFLGFDEFKTNYDLDINYLKYYGLITKLRETINKEGEEANRDKALNVILNVKSASKHFYKNILNSVNKNTQRKCFRTWERLIGQDLDWEIIFESLYRTTIDTKLRNFQFKLIHCIYADNRTLYKMGVLENDMCNFCNNERDSVTHYLWFCPVAQNFWTSVVSWMNSVFPLSIDISLKNILFGHHYCANNTQNSLINLFILISKHYLHCCKWRKTNPNITTLKLKVTQREKIEKDIAFQKGKIDLHNKKWQSVLNL